MQVLAFCFLVGAFLFLRSPFFTITNYEVYGNAVTPREEIIARCSQPSRNIFAFDVDKAARLIEASPWIERAVCKRKLPRTIVITVTERKPVAFAPIGGTLWLIDGQGRILGKDDGSYKGLIALTGVEGQATPGQFLDDSKYGWGLRVMSILGPLARKKATEVHVQDGECVLILDDGCKVLLGKERADAPRLMEILDSILGNLAESGGMAEQIDLRFDVPSIKFRQGAKPKG